MTATRATSVWKALLVLVAMAGAVFAAPNVPEGAILNNASYTTGSALAPGSIVAVFGTELTDGSSCLPPSCNPTFDGDGRLNTTIAGARVLVNGNAVPIFYAAPTQLGVQLPADLTGSSATVQVVVGGQSSATRTIAIEPFVPGIFSVNAQGTGAGAITHADGRLVNSQNPVEPGEIIILYATGLGQVSPLVATGRVPGGASETLTRPTIIVDGVAAEVQFSGLAGCCVGLNQLNVRVPATARPGNGVSLSLSMGSKQSNPVTVAVAGTAPPPPDDGYRDDY